MLFFTDFILAQLHEVIVHRISHKILIFMDKIEFLSPVHWRLVKFRPQKGHLDVKSFPVIPKIYEGK
jgi:hypothetical protein